MQDSMSQECFLCNDNTANIRKCQHCKLVSSCNPHMEKHSVNSRCLPIKVQETKSRGRILVATRLIEPGETVMVEEAAVKGFTHVKFQNCKVKVFDEN